MARTQNPAVRAEADKARAVLFSAHRDEIDRGGRRQLEEMPEFAAYLAACKAEHDIEPDWSFTPDLHGAYVPRQRQSRLLKLAAAAFALMAISFAAAAVANSVSHQTMRAVDAATYSGRLG